MTISAGSTILASDFIDVSGGASDSGKAVKLNGSGKIDSSMLSGAGLAGDGSDGALVISSGTTDIDLGAAQVVIKQYTSITISGTGALTFSNPHANGTTIIFKSQGDVSLTSTANPTIDLRGIGAAGGAGGAAGGGTGNAAGGSGGGAINGNGSNGTVTGGGNLGSDGNDGLGTLYKANKGLKGNNPAAVGGNGAINNVATASLATLAKHVWNLGILAIPGAGGGGGRATSSGGNKTGGNGGRGGGAFFIICGGTYTFSGGVINAAGTTGSSGGGQFAGSGGSGGGGVIGVWYNAIGTNSGTYTVNGGATATTTDGGDGGAGGTGFAFQEPL